MSTSGRLHRSLETFSISEDAAFTKEKVYPDVENTGVRIQVEQTTNTTSLIRVYTSGSANMTETLLESFSICGISTEHRSYLTQERLRIEVSSDSGATVSVVPKLSEAGALVTADAFLVNAEILAEVTKGDHLEVINCLNSINNQMKVMNFHLAIINETNVEEGDI